MITITIIAIIGMIIISIVTLHRPEFKMRQDY